jgi:hypothetical protein
MIIKIKMLVLVSSLVVLGLYEIGNAGSDIPKSFEYDLSYNKWAYSSHAVTFAHATHAMNYKIACIRCHHTLEEDAIAVEETCRDCHMNTEMRSFPQAESIPEEDRIDYYFLAIHDQCINCHKEVRKSDEWTKAPVGCWRCHVHQKK